MAKWQCNKCNYDRTLRSDGWVEECPFCNDPELDLQSEAVGYELLMPIGQVE